MANNIDTPGYFLKRLRDAGFVSIRLFSDYAPEDPRKWSIMVSPSKDSVMVTCYKNPECGLVTFRIDDGGYKWPVNCYIKTSSVNVIVMELIEHGVSMDDEPSKYIKKNEQ